MKLEALLAPISETEPCGPDLNAAMDTEYNYYFDSAGRLPGFYIQPGVNQGDGTRSPDKVFDPTSVDITAEEERIAGLLERSRDLRLLVLLAQWEALTGRIARFSEVLDSVAGLLEAFPDNVHPTLADGPAERREALSDLANPITVVQALQFAGLTGSNEVTLRKIRVASGRGTPLASEEDLSLDMLSQALGDPTHSRKVGEIHTAILRVEAALGRIERACADHPSAPFAPKFEPVHAVLADITEVIAAARPDLGSAATAANAEPPVLEENAVGATIQTPGVQAGTTAAPGAAMPGPMVSSHAQARLLLETCEIYYRANEPSSAVLLLVTQARLLIGKTLIEAMEALLPDTASAAVVDFGPQTGFALPMDRLRQLAETAPRPAEEAGTDVLQPIPQPPIHSATGAAAAIRSVEEYFRHAERSSPVPMLLQRAQSYVDKDFQALIEELIPHRGAP